MKRITEPAPFELDPLPAELPAPPTKPAGSSGLEAAAELADARAAAYRVSGDSARATALIAFAKELRSK